MVRKQGRLKKVKSFFSSNLGKTIPQRYRRQVRDFFYPNRRELLIDVVGSCSLKCPSCPVGNTGPINPTGRMDMDLFTKIVDKATSEYDIYSIGLYNWTEPLLHSQLPEFIKIIKDRGIHSSLSSNLNQLPNPEKIMEARPDYFRISLSGFTQEVYGKTHFKGNIEKVKANMALLAEAKRKVGNTETYVEVYFHKYLNNLHELKPMREYAESLGFHFLEDWAFFMPIEKVLDLVDGKLSETDQAFVDNELALPIKEAVNLAKESKHKPCWLMNGQLVLDVKGDLQLCCGTYDSKKNGLGSFLDLTPKQIATAKTSHSTCTKCMEEGVHVYGAYFGDPKLKGAYNKMALEKVAKHAKPLN